MPTIGINHSDGKLHPIVETTYLWPWLILVRLQPVENSFQTDMYNYVLPPWSLMIFIPFLICLRYCYKQFNNQDQKEKLAGIITLVAFIQMALIWLTYQSQEPFVVEKITMFYIPELLIILLQGFFGVSWYYNTLQKTLKTPASKTKVPKKSIEVSENTES